MANTTDKTVTGKYQPKSTNVIWVDTSLNPPVEKHFINGRWKSMGGGVSDYEDIKNKPTINGVELDGNKTSQDLGVYSKPSGGIPQSDLSSDVQSQLNKHFKGWYDSDSNLPANPVVGDYAYVKGATPSDPVAIYECTTAGTWSDSERTADTSNVQTFASGEEVNEVHIVNDLTTGGVDDVLSAEQGKKLGEEINQLDEKVDDLNNATSTTKKYLNLSSRVQKLNGYANSSGKFQGIGTAAQVFLYISVEAGKQYRMKGIYDVAASVYSNILFSADFPVENAFGIVIDSLKGNGQAFDVYYTPVSNGYILVWGKQETAYSFYEVTVTSEIDNLEKSDNEIKNLIGYDTNSELITEDNTIKGVVMARGLFDTIGRSPNDIHYFQVHAGENIRLTGTYGSYSQYAALVFSENIPEEDSLGVVIAVTDPTQTFDIMFTPDFDGYVFSFLVSNFHAYKIIPSIGESYVEKNEIFDYCMETPLQLVNKRYQSIYVQTSNNKIVSGDGSFVVPVLKDERYLIRANVHAYTQYAIVSFSTSITTGNYAEEIMKAVDEEVGEYIYEYNFIAPANGYLIVWAQSTANGYQNKPYVIINKLVYRQPPINDYYLPKSLKIQTFGDSITDNYWGDLFSWVNYVPENIPIENLTVVNSAVGGAGIGGNGEYNIPNQVMNGYTRTGGTYAAPLASDTDFVVIFAGTNDWSAGQPIASVRSNLATTFQYITEHSKAKILYCTPLQRYNSTDAEKDTDEYGVPINILGMTLRDFCDDVIEVCKRFSVPVLDLNAEANINRYNILDYSSDGLHTHRDGDVYISALICAKIKDMIRVFYKML